MSEHDEERIRNAVRNRYSSIAKGETCGCGTPSCCGEQALIDSQTTKMGYSKEEIESAPDGANLGLGCGNPHAFASMKEGEVVLDLGSGAGFDCFIASQKVGDKGKVIGVDMTPDMITKARENANKGGYSNVEFRLGEIEHLPVADSSVDVIISNCVINLSTDKQSVLNESLRVLRPGGRLIVSDIVATAEIPTEMKNDLVLYSSCAGGAVEIGVFKNMLEKAGFVDITITPKDESRELIRDWAPGFKIEDFLVSAIIDARKTKGERR